MMATLMAGIAEFEREVAVAEVLPTLDPVATAASLRLMVRDTREAVIWENIGPPRRERYLAGGPLMPERVEVTLGPRHDLRAFPTG